MNLADYRRFVSYIYAYRNGKKEKNTGFAKVEARKRNLRISIQLEAPENRETSLDAYGFIRKGEKNFGIFLGEMQKSSGPLYFLKVETDTDNIKGSGHSLNQFSGLWIKGEAGENYITIWNDEPVKRMDLEIEMEEEEQERDDVRRDLSSHAFAYPPCPRRGVGHARREVQKKFFRSNQSSDWKQTARCWPHPQKLSVGEKTAHSLEVGAVNESNLSEAHLTAGGLLRQDVTKVLTVTAVFAAAGHLEALRGRTPGLNLRHDGSP